MRLSKLKSDHRMTGDLFLSLSLVKSLWQSSYIKQLAKYTATTIHHTCNATIRLFRPLLVTNHKYVLLEEFTTELLQKEFCELRQESGGIYFVNV